MFLSEKENSCDPNYAHLKTLSFAYQPSCLGLPVTDVYGIIVEFTSDPLTSEKKFLTCYDNGFAAYYSTHHGGNINGKVFPDSGETQLASFEHFISSTNEIFPNSLIAKRSKHLLKTSTDYLVHTSAGNNILEDQQMQIWFLTNSGVFSGGANTFEIKSKKSVLSKFLKEAVSVCKDLEMFGRDSGILPKAASF